MIDTVKIFTPKISELVTRESFDHLTQIDETTNFKNNETYSTWQHHNFLITEDKDNFYLTGSLPKYFYGRNIHTLNLRDLRICIDNLSDELHWDLRCSKLSRVDVTDNLRLTNKPVAYRDCILGLPRFTSHIHGVTGIQLTNTCRTFTFYDKLVHMLKMGQAVPREFLGQNLLRYEMCIKKNVKDYLNLETNYVDEVLTRSGFLKLINVWEREFNKIRLSNDVVTGSLIHCLQYMTFYDHLVCKGIEAIGGGSIVYQELEKLYEMKIIGERYAVRNTRSRIQKVLSKLQPLNNAPDFAYELRDAVHTTATQNSFLLEFVQD